MKKGDKAKGFRFELDSYSDPLMTMTSQMYKWVGVVGTIREIKKGAFMIDFGYERWWYPTEKYLALLREEKLDELGI